VGNPLSMICGSYGLLHEVLAALAHPLAADVPVHEELGRHDVQPLAHVLADTHHLLAALGRGAQVSCGSWQVLDTAQVFGQLLAARLALGCLQVRAPPRGAMHPAGLATVRLQVCLVLGQRILEHLALLGVHRLGLGTKLPRLQPRQLERDALDLGVLELDLAITPGDMFVLGRERGLLGRQLCQQLAASSVTAPLLKP
jgi:hypothetical protein